MTSAPSGDTAAARDERDEEVRVEHARATAAGERRTLARTRAGRLHSYARDEVGLVRAGSQGVVTTAAGMAVLAAFFLAVAALSVVLVVLPTTRGADPMWGALLLTAAALAAAAYAGRLSRVDVAAGRRRRWRGVPEPSARTSDPWPVGDDPRG